MECYEYQTKQQKNKSKDPNAKEKYFVLPEDYEKLIKYSLNFQEKALWEIMYLSGARPSEILTMNIGGVNDNGVSIEITVLESKTKPRKIPLSEYPEHLMRWIENHPYKNQPDNPVWINNSHRPDHKDGDFGKRLIYMGLRAKLIDILKKAKIDKPFTPKCFRKTRATIMFPENDDGTMAMYFGWEVESVPQRRRYYDLSNYDDLLKKIQVNVNKPPSYYVPQKQKEQLESQHKKEMDELKNKMEQVMERMNIMNKALNSQFGKYMLNDKSETYEKIEVDPETLEPVVIAEHYPDRNLTTNEITNKYIKLRNNAENILSEKIRNGTPPKEIRKYRELIELLLT